jgi:hypothetical protein
VSFLVKKQEKSGKKISKEKNRKNLGVGEK